MGWYGMGVMVKEIRERLRRWCGCTYVLWLYAATWMDVIYVNLETVMDDELKRHLFDQEDKVTHRLIHF